MATIGTQIKDTHRDRANSRDGSTSDSGYEGIGTSSRRRSYAVAASKAEKSSDSGYSGCQSSGKITMKQSYTQAASHAPGRKKARNPTTGAN